MNRFLILGVALAGLTGCNTVSGLGNDLQVIGGAVSGAASDVQSGRSSGAAGEAQAAACAPDAHGRVQAECGPPPLNAPAKPPESR